MPGTLSKQLNEAAKTGKVEKVLKLLNQGVDPNETVKSGRSPLGCALKGNHIAVIEVLLRFGANVNQGCKHGESLLYLAAKWRLLNATKLFLKSGANPNQEGGFTTPIFCAAENNDLAIMNTLIRAGADFNGSNIISWTPLHIASYRGNVNVVVSLLKVGADFNRTSNNGSSPLHCAILHRRGAVFSDHSRVKRELGVLDALLKAGADPNKPDLNGSTPLHVAARFGGHLCVLGLLKAGANPYQVNDNGLTAIKEAKSRPQCREALEILEKWPRVVSLRMLCLRVIHLSPNKPPVPDWLPRPVLRWFLLGEFLLARVSPPRIIPLDRGQKRKAEGDGNDEGNKRERLKKIKR